MTEHIERIVKPVLAKDIYTVYLELLDEVARLKSEFEIVRKAFRLFEEASNIWMERALKAEAALKALEAGK